MCKFLLLMLGPPPLPPVVCCIGNPDHSGVVLPGQLLQSINARSDCSLHTSLILISVFTRNFLRRAPCCTKQHYPRRVMNTVHSLPALLPTVNNRISLYIIYRTQVNASIIARRFGRPHKDTVFSPFSAFSLFGAAERAEDIILEDCRSMSDVTGWAAHKLFLGVTPAVPDFATKVLDRDSGNYIREKVGASQQLHIAVLSYDAPS